MINFFIFLLNLTGANRTALRSEHIETRSQAVDIVGLIIKMLFKMDRNCLILHCSVRCLHRWVEGKGSLRSKHPVD